jgi:hypothetical protein
MEKSETLKQMVSEEGLTERMPGFFNFPENKLPFGNYDRVAIAVHAYYYRERSTGNNSGYRKAIDDFVAKKTCPIVFALNEVRFEESRPSLKQALDWVRDLGAAERSWAYFTIPMDSQPIERWSNTILGIQQAFSPKLIEIAGAELHYTVDRQLAYSGCVNGTINQLKTVFPVAPLPQYCWSDVTYIHRKPNRYSEDDKFFEYEARTEYLKDMREKSQSEKQSISKAEKATSLTDII